jgi:predicted ATP-grasp superfamily ATP-dependent carboligase
MRVFVYEYTCGGSGGGAALHAEGWAMLAAVVEDFVRCTGVAVATMLDRQLRPEAKARWSGSVGITEASPQSEQSAFQALAAAADWSLVIAPEFDGILAQRCRWVLEAGGRLLGPWIKSVELTADKLELSRLLHRNDVPTPATRLCDLQAPPRWPLPWVCKPRDGAGSQATCLVRQEDDLGTVVEQARAEGWRGELVVQPFFPGLPASVSCLVGPDVLVLFPAAEQCLSEDGRFSYRGAKLPLPPALIQRAQRLAERAVRCVGGLFGYVGTDMVLGQAEDGSQDAVIEINPRLTTSYAGLRRWARFNIAEAMLAVADGKAIPEMAQGTTIVYLHADGQGTKM